MNPTSGLTLENQIAELIREAFWLGPDTVIDADSILADELDIDSMSLVKLDMLLEARVGIALPMEHMDGVETIRDLAEALRKYGVPTADKADLS
jgi:acyl carrier protein